MHQFLRLSQSYFTLCKPRVVLLMLITALVGMCLSTPANIPWQPLVFGLLGIALAAASAAAINHVIDRDLDKKMKRTERRPLVQGEIKTHQAYIFAAILCVLSMLVLSLWVNMLVAAISFLTLVAYAVVYTVFLKHATPQNIVIGGIAGAAPPLLGWACVSNSIDPQALLLVLIIFIWTPPHFWALAIYRVDDYAKAKVPMLPNTHGIAYTKLNVSLYTAMLVAATLLPYAVGMLHELYLIFMLVLNGIYIYYNLRLQFSSQRLWAIKSFKFSIVYLFVLFVAMLVDHYYFFTLQYKFYSFFGGL